jgi:hypothetical protein
MPYKDPKKQKAAQNAWYQKNKAITRERSKSSREKNKEIIRNIKESSPCSDCQIFYPYYIMQFDHVEPENKVDAVNRLLTTSGIEKVLNEVSKCDLVCANCHAFRTWKRQNSIEGI